MHSLDGIAATKAQDELDQYDVQTAVTDIVDIVAGQ